MKAENTNTLKNDLAKLNESFLNTGKVRAMVLTVEGLSKRAKDYLRLSKKDSKVYNAIDTAVWRSLSDKISGKELLTVVHKLAIFEGNNLEEYANELYITRCNKEIVKCHKAINSKREAIADLKEQLKTSPIGRDQLDTMEMQLSKLNDKLEVLNDRLLIRK